MKTNGSGKIGLKLDLAEDIRLSRPVVCDSQMPNPNMKNAQYSSQNCEYNEAIYIIINSMKKGIEINTAYFLSLALMKPSFRLFQLYCTAGMKHKPPAIK